MKRLVLIYGLLVVAILLLGCQTYPQASRVISPELLPYVEEFERITGRMVYFEVTFADLSKTNWAGVCTKDRNQTNGFRFVKIDTKTFQIWQRNYYAIEQLIFHELGHCLLNMDHKDKMVDWCPVSIMYPQMFGHTECYFEDREKYIEELKRKANQ